MPQSLAQLYVHVVFSTKDRYRFLHDMEVRDELHRYLGGTCNRLACPVLSVGGVDDHVHLLLRVSRTITMADLVQELKRESSKWIKTRDRTLDKFHWQGGYGAFSISPNHVDTLRSYIANQAEHHKRESYQEEFRRLLAEHGLEWDERYVWE